MAYLQPSEYVAFGLSAETSDAWIAAASAMIEAHCRRSSLLLTSVTERLRVARQSGTVQLTYGPISEVTALQARYRPHASCTQDGVMAQWALAFGAPQQWVSLDVTSVTVDTTGGELTLPWNLLGFQYSEVEVTYMAGMNEIPESVKIACAQIVKNAQSTSGFNVRSSKLDTLQTQYFSDSLMDSQVKALLRPFVAERVG